MRYISFDLYGTLLRYDDLDGAWRDWHATLHAELARHGVRMEAEELARVCARFFQEDIAVLEGHSVFESRLFRLAERLDCSLSADGVARIADACCAAWQQSIMPDPDCVETLQALAGRHTLFLISNFDHPRHVRRLLGEVGILPFFAEILISGEQGVKKPNAALFRRLKEKYEVGPYECIHVGDSIEDYHFAVNSELVPVLLGEERTINGWIDFRENATCRVQGAHYAARLKDVVETISNVKQVQSLQAV